MNLQNKYLETIFNVKYFGIEAMVVAQNKIINLIKEEQDSIQSYQDYSITGNGNKYMCKSNEVASYALVENSSLLLNGDTYEIKTLKDNLDGTTQLTLEKQ
jgi:hypothetical protein